MVYIPKDIDTAYAQAEAQVIPAYPIDLPKGSYTWAVAKCECRATKSETPSWYVHMPLLVLDGPHAGQMQKFDFFYADADGKTNERGVGDFKRALLSLGVNIEAQGIPFGVYLMNHLPSLVGTVVSGAVGRTPKKSGEGEWVNVYLNTVLPGYEIPAALREKIAMPASEFGEAPTDVVDPFANQG